MIAITTYSTDDTKGLGKATGHVLRGGEIFALSSDVGGGKTAFVKGLARGLGVSEVVQSPTFTISRIYKARNGLELHHFDFYRLQDAGVVAAELAESLQQPNAIVAVEWGDIVHNVMPQKVINVKIATIDDQVRHFNFELSHFDYVQAAIVNYKEQKHTA